MAVNIVVSPAGDIITDILETSRSSREVNATITAAGDSGEIIKSIVVTLEENEPEVFITNGVETASIVGKYIDPFEDVFTYVEKGSSDKLETPKVVIGTQNMPPDKDFYDLSQDTRSESIRHYTVLVSSDLGSETFYVNHSIYNEWEGMRSFVDNYVKPPPIDNYDTN